MVNFDGIKRLRCESFVKFKPGQLVSTFDIIGNIGNRRPGLVVESVYARFHRTAFARDVSKKSNNFDLGVVRIMFNDGYTWEFFDDEVIALGEYV